jgi:uncharacterized protein YdhG (YjbR/CyaY superfamily)
MSKTSFDSVDEYIASQPEAARATLERVRSIIRRALPKAKERISYQIPAYEQHGGCVIYFAGWKKHFSLYPVSERVLMELEVDPSDYDVNDKGTIRFPLSEPVPEKLIARIAKLRAKQEEQRQREKQEARRTASRPAAAGTSSKGSRRKKRSRKPPRPDEHM